MHDCVVYGCALMNKNVYVCMSLQLLLAQAVVSKLRYTPGFERPGVLCATLGIPVNGANAALFERALFVCMR